MNTTDKMPPAGLPSYESPAKAGRSTTPHSRKYAWYTVVVLCAAYICSFIDRSILNLMVIPIKQDLNLSDTQIGLLQGFAFAICYTVMGLPMSRIADTWSRRGIITIGITVWSFMTALCGIANSYLTLFLARIGVGAGESTLSPSTYSIISDIFPPERLATPLSVYSSGAYIGTGASLLIGGVVVDSLMSIPTYSLPLIGAVKPWQMAFMAVGLPGLLIAILVITTIKDPQRRLLPTQPQDKANNPSLREVYLYVQKNRTIFFAHFLSFAFLSLAGYSMASWMPTYFIRVFDWPVAKTAHLLGTILIIVAPLAMVCGGRITDRMMRNRMGAPFIIGAISATGLCLSGIIVGLATDASLAVTMLYPAFFFAAFPVGAGLAALQLIAPPGMKAQLSALFLFVDAMVGLGFGPLAVALFTDYVFVDEMAVGKSIASVIGITMPIAIILLLSKLRAFSRLAKEQYTSTMHVS